MAWNTCRQRQCRLIQLKQVRRIYEELKYYISYQKATVPEALWRLCEKNQSPFSEAFAQISMQVQQEGMDFAQLWEKQMEEVLQDTELKKEERQLLLAFPSCLGFMEEEAQAAALDEPIRELERRISELETQQKDKNKVIMSLGIAGGIFLSILLL